MMCTPSSQTHHFSVTLTGCIPFLMSPQFPLVWYGMVWYGMVWYGILGFNVPLDTQFPMARKPCLPYKSSPIHTLTMTYTVFFVVVTEDWKSSVLSELCRFHDGVIVNGFQHDHCLCIACTDLPA